jgi:hypothetical protein
MSKVKSPQEKKQLSLDKDRRNVYGECPSSSRKNIRRGKQRSHMELRRGASQDLAILKGASMGFDADEVESRTKTRILDAERSAFRKRPDAPLGTVIKRKAESRSKGRSGIRPIQNV